MPRESRREKLKRAKAQQAELEKEYNNLTKATDPKDAAKEIIDFIENKGVDPMTKEEENPFHIRNCFVEGTKILINKETNESKTIENIKIGDVIESILVKNNNNYNKYNKNKNKNTKNTNKFILKSCNGIVTNTINNITFKTCKIILNNNNIIECTLNHPFFVPNEGIIA